MYYIFMYLKIKFSFFILFNKQLKLVHIFLDTLCTQYKKRRLEYGTRNAFGRLCSIVITKLYTLSRLLEKFWRISLHVTHDAIGKLYVT